MVRIQTLATSQLVSGENESINVNENGNGKFLIVPLTVSQIQKPPNNFVIHKSGYYWYVVSTLLSESKNVCTSHEYRLSKLYFDKASLGQSHDCLLSEPSTRECVVANSLFSQTSTKQVLVSVAVTNTEFSSPYKVTVNKKYAIGIALIPFATLELPALVAFISLSVYCVHKYCCQ